ncbi:S-adenosyl-L-methionine-dependent methyltransferase [Mycotypha africana]|uniref:S-adenosyl-L-methionine-dependent methyltransferase n=1 Tax=Mycotypha africana TaxID=64632 RepID=UPI002301218B|nr:S-adenosyl-L-methionine-dependent methyltransferase [Mycotypha africana]KAI8987595.1 S-adenosyl-L-methionine-dependent methyltransferase [Mycotypha africana]
MSEDQLRTNIDWEKKWQQGRSRWDYGQPSPALVTLLQTEEARVLIPASGLGLVPGCGHGYDVEFFASEKRHMRGLEISQTCVDLLNQKYPNAKEENFDFICADFFDFEVPEQKYNLVYDYTFLCAMEPYLRPQWAKRMNEIIAKDGVLITLMYPVNGQEEEGGPPPFPLSEEIYHDLLADNFELMYINDAIGHAERFGMEKIAIWKKK